MRTGAGCCFGFIHHEDFYKAHQSVVDLASGRGIEQYLTPTLLGQRCGVRYCVVRGLGLHYQDVGILEVLVCLLCRRGSERMIGPMSHSNAVFRVFGDKDKGRAGGLEIVCEDIAGVDAFFAEVSGEGFAVRAVAEGGWSVLRFVRIGSNGKLCAGSVS